MTPAPQVVVHHDESSLAAAIAARLITRVVEAQQGLGDAHVCLTGGGIGTAVLAAVAASPARAAVDWVRLSLWWGDERYLPPGDPERNETGARAALLDQVPLDPRRVHPMPASGAYGSVEAAAAAYADQLAEDAGPGLAVAVPAWDVALLGIGPEGHVASLFPEQPALHAEGSVVAVHGSPKPPPVRISLTLAALQAAREVWILASGASKARAVRLALDDEVGILQLPAAGARGTERTLFLLDTAAAAELPASLPRPV